MRRTCLLLAALALGITCPAVAQTSPSPPQATPTPTWFTLGRIDFGLQTADPDTDSSKFREYRDVPNGVVVPFFRLFGEEKYRFDLYAENVRQDDARYRLFVERGPLRVKAEYDKIPHRFGNEGRMLFEETARGVLAMSDTLQQAHQTAIESQFARSPAGVNFPFLSSLVAPSLAAANTIDLALQRERGKVDLSLTPDQPVDVRLTYSQEKRRGNRAAGTSFGFGNVVEAPEPIEYRTQDIGASAEYTRRWGLLRGALRYNEFSNPINTLTFDNPFRATDSTDPAAYTAPGAGSIAGSSRGRVDLSADNEAITGSLGFLLRLPANSRFTADVSVAEWTQNDRFMPYTINSAITSPLKANDPSTLPERSLDGKVNVLSQSYLFTSRPIPRLAFTARFRSYDLDNDTRRISFPGYVRFDAVWEEIPRISVPYGYKTDRADATLSYEAGPVTLEGGYRYVKWNRTFRETRETTEDTFIGAVGLHAFGWAQLRASYETGKRDRDHYETERSEHASYLEPGPPANLLELRRFDQAERDVDRLSALLQLSPGSDFTISFSYLYGRDDYTREPVVAASGLRYGLLDAKNESFTAEADYSPSERWSVYSFYTREKISTFQRGRQSGGVLSTDPRNDWTADVEDKVDSYGGGGTVALVPDKLDFRAFCRYQKLDGNNDLFSPPGGTPDVAFDIPIFDDTKILTLSAEFGYRLASAWSLALGGWFEDYEIRDSASTGLQNYVPGSFFLAANDSDYEARVGYVRASYRW